MIERVERGARGDARAVAHVDAGRSAVHRHAGVEAHLGLERDGAVREHVGGDRAARADADRAAGLGEELRLRRYERTLGDFLFRLTEPALRPIRRILPNLGGVDLSPMVLILLVWFIRRLMREYLL